jgi:hypothetical protein
MERNLALPTWTSNVVIALMLSLLPLWSVTGPAQPALGATTTCLSSDFASDSGDGTSWEEAFKIANRDHLFQLNYCTTSTYDNTFFELVSDIDLKSPDPSATWSPIGLIRNADPFSADSIFFGNLNGNGFEISNIDVDIRSGNTTRPPLAVNSSRNGGLFRTLQSAQISNIRLSGSAYADYNVGLLAGQSNNNNLFSNIVVQADVRSLFQNAGAVIGDDDSNNWNTYSGVVARPLDGNSSVRGYQRVGGVIGSAGKVTLTDVFSDIDVAITAEGITNETAITSYAGGLIGTASTVNIFRALVRGDVEIQRDTSGASTGEAAGGVLGRLDGDSNMGAVGATGNVFANQIAGGFVGELRTSHISHSFAVGDVTVAGLTNSPRAGGFFGQTYATSGRATLIQHAYSSGTVACLASCEIINSALGGFAGIITGPIEILDVFSSTRISVSTQVNFVGGFSGRVQSPQASISRVVTLGELNLTATPTNVGGLFGSVTTATGANFLNTSDLTFTASGSVADDTGNVSTVYGASLSPEAFSNLTNFTSANGWSIEPATSPDASTWRMCDFPVLAIQPLPSGCNGAAAVVEVDQDSSLDINPATGPSQGGTISTIKGRNLSSVTGVRFGSATSPNVFVTGTRVWTLTPAGSGQVPVSLLGSQELDLSTQFTYTSLGPAASVSSSVTPSSLTFQVECSGVCSSSIPDSYSISITPTNGGATQTLVNQNSFTGLPGNTSYQVSVTIESGGLTSAANTFTLSTAQPIATISALTVADTSATLTIGCTNCGSDPDSFTISATPQGGGAAITSNTNVIPGLTSETTYSFAVVIAFAGTTSDSVNWQDNPVMTLPFLPIISSVSPAALPLTGGTVTVTGANFTTSTELTFGGSTESFTIVSGTEITFTAPPGTAGSFDLSIQNQVGPFTLPNAITYVSGPSLSAIAPVLATTNGGTIVTLTGTDLATTTQVNVGSTTVSFSVISNTAVRFITAATTAGIVDVGVVTVGGTATKPNGLEFTDSALVPVVVSITPATGPIAGGTTVTITGQFFSGSYSDSVSAAINGVSGSSLVLIDDSTLTFVTPAHAEGTGFDVTVLTGGGLGTLAGAFSYTAPPVTSAGVGSGPAVILSTPEIITFSTRQLPASGGQITAEGRRLADISSMTLGGIRVTIVSNTDTSVTFTVLEMPVGTWDLRLVGVNGTLTFQQAITIVGQEVLLESTPGTMLGFTMTLRFTGNNRTLNVVQERNLTGRLDRFSTAETIICWGYTTAANPNAWAIAHATARAKAACDLAIGGDSALKSAVRLRYGVSKDFAMRAALQFWR